MTIRDERRAEEALQGLQFSATKDDVVKAVREGPEREDARTDRRMTRLSAEEAGLIFLALEEYASGFSLSLPAEEIARVRDLARRIADAGTLSFTPGGTTTTV